MVSRCWDFPCRRQVPSFGQYRTLHHWNRMADNLTLRALSLGELLDASFGLYRRLFVPLVFVSIATQTIPLALSIYIEASGGAFEHPMLWSFATIRLPAKSNVSIPPPFSPMVIFVPAASVDDDRP